MAEYFDVAANDYDSSFTNSQIGRLQRERVYHYLKKYIFARQKKNVLEVNCGTGEDAVWLAKKCDQVIATDISPKMLHQAEEKSRHLTNLKFEILNLDVFEERVFENTFDFIFSNFGGLNCLSPSNLEKFIHECSSKLQENGQVVLVIMPKKCMMERLYFLIKGQIKNVFRRNTNNALMVNVSGQSVKTWYYDPIDIEKYALQYFNIVTKKPIGLFVPPSYLNKFFSDKKPLLNFFAWLDKKFDSFDFLSPYADHFLIILQKR